MPPKNKKNTKPPADPTAEIWYVEVVEFGTGVIEETMGPHALAKAKAIERGVDINLDVSRYMTRTVARSGGKSGAK